MIEEERIAWDPGAVAEAREHLRIDGAQEDGVIAALMGSATAVCEAFTGQVVQARAFGERVEPGGSWTRLGRTPVIEISSVETGGVPVAGYAVDIDANGDGWVRFEGSPAEDARGLAVVRIAYRAGLAATWAEVPDGLRHGIVRLAAHGYAQRGGNEDASPPAAVTALWRPHRRMRLR